MSFEQENSPKTIQDLIPTTKVCASCGKMIDPEVVVVVWIDDDVHFMKGKDIPRGAEAFCCTKYDLPFPRF
jgi:hypothetical protein